MAIYTDEETDGNVTDWNKNNEIDQFIEDWAQTEDEICSNLDYDLEDCEDLLMIDYFYESLREVWIPKSSSCYTQREQEIADELRF